MGLRVDLNGNGTGFEQMLRRARMQTKEFAEQISEEAGNSFSEIGRSFTGAIAGMFAFEGIKKAFDWFVDTGNQVKDISEQLGMSTDQWQKWSDAVQQAGLQTEGFARIVESIKQKRTEALTDPKARAMLSQLGFTDADISGSMSTSDFVKKALQDATTGGPYAKQAFDTIAGVEGVRYTRALDYLPQAQAAFTDEDIRASQEAQKALHGLALAAEKAGLSMTSKFLQWAQTPGMLRDSILAVFKPHSAKQVTEDMAGLRAFRGHGAGGSWTDKNPVPTGTPEGPYNPQNDPLYATLQQQERDIALHDRARRHQELESSAGLMTIGDRRRAIMAEMGPLTEQIAQHEKALSTPEGFLTQAQKDSLEGVNGLARVIQVNALREKYKDELTSLRVEMNRDRGQLKQSPLTFQADSLARVGLYSASALRFNPVLGLQQEANHLLKQIATNTAKPSLIPPNDPHRP